MAHLTKPQQYNIEDSNIALLGSDLEKRVREHAGDKESAWESCGQAPSLEIWRIEKFSVVPWPRERFGSFYSGDSYIVLKTYKKRPDSLDLAYNLHFWLGSETTQDEAGTAAYKTVELDDHLHGVPVQYREVQDYESAEFIANFPHFQTLHGGVSTGFHHVHEAPPLALHRLYHIKALDNVGSEGAVGRHNRFVIRQVTPNAASFQNAYGDVLVLDKGAEIWQFNRSGSAGKERFKGAEFVQSIVDGRKAAGNVRNVDVKVYDERGPGASVFLAELEVDPASLAGAMREGSGTETEAPRLFRLSDASGAFVLERATALASADVFILDCAAPRAVYTWIGKGASEGERRMALEFGQRYLWSKAEAGGARAPLVREQEGQESGGFVDAMRGVA